LVKASSIDMPAQSRFNAVLYETTHLSSSAQSDNCRVSPHAE
jgi:hypothetical protein